MRRRFLFLALLLCLISTLSTGKTPATPRPAPCGGPEWRQMDFWIGEWDLTWPAWNRNPAGTGTNRIEKILGGCVVEERFAANGPAPLVGRSVSTYEPRSKKWKQTWVDNQGSYLDFEGGLDGERMVLSRKGTNREGKPQMSRMVFLNITSDSLDWRWEKSEDVGKSWQLMWPIHYAKRRNATPSPN
jgi:hypothetical protein